MSSYLITLTLAIASVGMWTLRVAVTSRGNRAASSVIAMLEATTYVVTVSHIIQALDAPTHLVVYAIGVGFGTYGGLTVDRRLRAIGFSGTVGFQKPKTPTTTRKEVK